MIDLILKPLVSIGPFALGVSRPAARKAALDAGLAFKHERKDLDYFADNGIQVEYGDDGMASFIGVSSGGADYRLLYESTELFDTPADVVFDFMSARDGSGPHAFDRNECLFPNQIIALWEADEQYDYIRRKSGQRPLRQIWGQVAIGSPGYKEAVARILAR